jgi:flagellar basal body-associated protein FliL
LGQTVTHACSRVAAILLVATIAVMSNGCGSISLGPFSKPEASSGWVRSSGSGGPMLTLPMSSITFPPGGRYQYAKLAVTVELAVKDSAFYALKGEARTKAEEAIIAAKQPEVPLFLEAVADVMATESTDELASPAGREQLKSDLLGAFRRRTEPESITAVYLDDFAVQ